MQMNQYVGLNEWARSKVLAKRTAIEIGERTYDDGSKELFERSVKITIARITKVGSIEGIFDEVVADLRRFELPTGEVFEEYVEASPCFGGPMFYTALKGSDGTPVRESLWGENAGAALDMQAEQPEHPKFPDFPDWAKF